MSDQPAVNVQRPDPPRTVFVRDSKTGRGEYMRLIGPTRYTDGGKTQRVIALLEETAAKYGTADGRAALEKALQELRDG